MSVKDRCESYHYYILDKVSLGMDLAQHERVFEEIYNAKSPVPCYRFSKMTPAILQYGTRIYKLRHDRGIPIKQKYVHKKWYQRLLSKDNDKHSVFYIEGINE